MTAKLGFHSVAIVVAVLSGSAALAQNSGAWVDPPPLQTAPSPAPQAVSPPAPQDSSSAADSSPKPQSTEAPRSVAAPLPGHPVPSAGRQSSRSKAPLVTRPARTGMAQVAPPHRLSRIGHPTAPRVRRPATPEVPEVVPPRRLSRIGHPTATRVRKPAMPEVAEVAWPRDLSRIGPSFNCHGQDPRSSTLSVVLQCWPGRTSAW
jgi:hypothetical protein